MPNPTGNQDLLCQHRASPGRSAQLPRSPRSILRRDESRGFKAHAYARSETRTIDVSGLRRSAVTLRARSSEHEVRTQMRLSAPANRGAPSASLISPPHPSEAARTSGCWHRACRHYACSGRADSRSSHTCRRPRAEPDPSARATATQPRRAHRSRWLASIRHRHRAEARPRADARWPRRASHPR